MSDLELDKNYKKGHRGNKVKLIQEWLCLHGFNIVIDKKFESATEKAVMQFQRKKGLEVDGVVGKNTFAQLILPMTRVLEPIPPDRKSRGQMLVAYARQHLKQHPREVGGQNMGPWVRLYMDGEEGVDWPWCAGFACFLLKQACDSLNSSLPITTSVSCDSLAHSAKQNDVFLKQSEAVDRRKITPGSFFLKRRTSTDWTHTGIVLRAEEEVFHTIEGNTNDEGSREGKEVCKRIQGYDKRDFILI